MALALRLLALIAVLLMPLGMTAPAQAHPTMGMVHCPDQAPAHHSNSTSSECTIACAAALSAVERVGEEPLSIIRTAARPTDAHPLDGLHPETATPPPRPS
jgi:hypothetical protein